MRTKLVGDGCQHCNPQVTFDSLQDEIQSLRTKLSQAEAEKAELVSASTAVVDRWHTPAWKDAPYTAEFINRLENALLPKENDND
jgi:hypothetical protein